MRYELELVKNKAIVVKNSTTNETAIGCLLDIIRLSEVCLEAMNGIDVNITSLALDTRRVTTDID